ncbi:MAG: hypothetical protein ACXVCE_11535, partial [Bacteriovorax sp.]
MGQGHNNDDDDSRRDLTRIEDLSEFLHEDDPELELKFGEFEAPADGTTTDLTSGVSLEDLDLPPELPAASDEAEEKSEEKFEEQYEEELQDFPDVPFELSTEDNAFNVPNEELQEEL